jgi:primosomal protein N'
LKEHAQIFPVSPAGHPKIKDLYRFQFIVKTLKISHLSQHLKTMQGKDVKIDVDPLSTFF